MVEIDDGPIIKPVQAKKAVGPKPEGRAATLDAFLGAGNGERSVQLKDPIVIGGERFDKAIVLRSKYGNEDAFALQLRSKDTIHTFTYDMKGKLVLENTTDYDGAPVPPTLNNHHADRALEQLRPYTPPIRKDQKIA